MPYHFSVLFDKNYLSRALALYNSMLTHCKDFKLWALCMDEKSIEILQKMNLKNIELLSLKEIENEGLLRVKEQRDAAEYSWTCKPFLVSYILNKNPEIDSIAYFDTDLLFFSSPKPIYEELKNNSMLLTPHHYIKEDKKWENVKGIYNAGVIFFKNDKNTHDCLKWWKDRCIEWCFRKHEDGKFADQAYLNKWADLFPGVYVSKLRGVNFGPWQKLSGFKTSQKNNEIFINNNLLILFHFHGFQIFSNSKFLPSGYQDDPQNVIYQTYFKELKKANAQIKLIDKNFNFGFQKKPNYLIKKIKTIIKRSFLYKFYLSKK